ncbi:hypothetical protein DL768_011309 [Monosporascus sp. mg162]|nr:hypothetical protein DL768_011309 [Monosporascus sp. mg162]
MSHQQENLIDLSPPPSGATTPIRDAPPEIRHTQSEPQPDRPHERTATGSSNYSIGSALSGLWRRFSSADSAGLQQQHPPHSHLSPADAVPAAKSGDGIHGAFTPPRRAVSPRLLPTLEPLTLTGYRPDTEPDERLLSRGIAEEIRTFLPERLKIGEEWKLVYSLYQNGSSLATMYKLCEEYRGRRVGFVLVVRDGKEGTFGAYLTEAPHPAPSYFGTGECFLWRASIHSPRPPPPSADTSNLNMRSTTIAEPPGATNGHSHSHSQQQQPRPSSKAAAAAQAQHSVRFQNFAYSGANDYCIFCETGFLSVGGGSGGRFGIWLDDTLSRGHSAPCDTFANQGLSEEGEKFDVLGVELWVIGASNG